MCGGKCKVERQEALTLAGSGGSELKHSAFGTLLRQHVVEVTSDDTQCFADAVAAGFGNHNFLRFLSGWLFGHFADNGKVGVVLDVAA